MTVNLPDERSLKYFLESRLFKFIRSFELKYKLFLYKCEIPNKLSPNPTDNIDIFKKLRLIIFIFFKIRLPNYKIIN